MAQRTPLNERLKRRYLQRLKEVKGRDEASIDAVAKALERYEQYAKYRDFRKFHVELVIAFKAHLSEQTNARTGERLSASTVYATLNALKAFYQWLANQPECRKLTEDDADWFNSPDNLARVATARRYKPGATIEQFRLALEAMPANSDIELRNRAVFATALLTGARDRALVSLRLKHVDLERKLIQQDARQVRTKFAKTFTTWFFPVGQDFEKILADWVAHLRSKGFGDKDPLFPRTRATLDPASLAHVLDREPWANATPVRTIFKEAFARVGLPYFNPHLIRNTLAQLAYDLELSPERLKAWSQNYGHNSLLTTLTSYGPVSPARQGQLIRELANGKPDAPSDDLFAEFEQFLLWRKRKTAA